MSLRRKRGKGKDQRVAEAGAEAEDEDEATIDIRWRGRNNRAQRPSIGPNYRYRVETSTCHVVESDEFDLIIGRPTINRLKLFTRNTDIFGGFRGVNKVKGMSQASVYSFSANT